MTKSLELLCSEQARCGKEKKEDGQCFMVGRDGDFLVFPFPCDSYWFRNLEGRLPWDGSYADELVLACIRRVNLDGTSDERNMWRPHILPH